MFLKIRISMAYLSRVLQFYPAYLYVLKEIHFKYILGSYFYLPWNSLLFKCPIYIIHIYSVPNTIAFALCFCSLLLSSLILIEHLQGSILISLQNFSWTYFYFSLIALEFTGYVLINLKFTFEYAISCHLHYKDILTIFLIPTFLIFF